MRKLKKWEIPLAAILIPDLVVVILLIGSDLLHATIPFTVANFQRLAEIIGIGFLIEIFILRYCVNETDTRFITLRS